WFMLTVKVSAVVLLLPSTTEASLTLSAGGVAGYWGGGEVTKVVWLVPVSKKVTFPRLLFIRATWPDQVPTATVPSSATSMSRVLPRVLGAPATELRVTLPRRVPAESKCETTLVQLTA